MSEQNDQPPPPTETAASGGDAASKQEEQAPPVTEPQEGGGGESAKAKETTPTKGGDQAEDGTAPVLTEPKAETQPQGKTQPKDETQPESETPPEAQAQAESETAAQDEEAPAEGSEQQPLPPDLEHHIFDGEIKPDRDGDYYASGYHHREGGVDDGDFTVDEATATPTDSHGVYEAGISGTAPDGTEVSKTSSFFPDSYSEDDVRGAVREAFDNRTESSPTNPRQWEGVTGDGMTIQGYVRPGTTVADATEDDIRTAYPLWEGRFLL